MSPFSDDMNICTKTQGAILENTIRTTSNELLNLENKIMLIFDSWKRNVHVHESMCHSNFVTDEEKPSKEREAE